MVSGCFHLDLGDLRKDERRLARRDSPTGSSDRPFSRAGATRPRRHSGKFSRTATTARRMPRPSSRGSSTPSAHARPVPTGWSCRGSRARRSPATTSPSSAQERSRDVSRTCSTLFMRWSCCSTPTLRSATSTTLASPRPVSVIEIAGKVIARADRRSTIKLVPYEEAYGPGLRGARPAGAGHLRARQRHRLAAVELDRRDHRRRDLLRAERGPRG